MGTRLQYHGIALRPIKHLYDQVSIGDVGYIVKGISSLLLKMVSSMSALLNLTKQSGSTGFGAVLGLFRVSFRVIFQVRISKPVSTLIVFSTVFSSFFFLLEYEFISRTRTARHRSGHVRLFSLLRNAYSYHPWAIPEPYFSC